MKIIAAAIAVVIAASSANAFIANKPKQPLRQLHILADAAPAGLTDYLAKAHEAKLKAVEAVENAKNAEIEALKKELAELKGSGAAAVAPSSGPIQGSHEDLAAKLLSYQNFMAKYIVDSQLEKAKAVKAAEEAVTKKFEAKLDSMGGSSKDAKAETPAPSVASTENNLYAQRSARVTEAAKAGKSRWGDKENARAAKAASGVTKTAPVKVTVTPTKGTTNVGAAILNGAVNGSANGSANGAVNGEIKETSTDLAPLEMVSEVLRDYEIMVKHTTNAIEVTQKIGDYATEDALKGYLSEIEKNHWMFTAFVTGK